MKTKHVFVPALDVGEQLPFVIRKTSTVAASIKEQDRAKKELVKFIDKLERVCKQSIFYMGMDIIAGKSYERFIFDKGGFLEIMVEAPVALNAHFVHENQAKQFCAALKKTLITTLPRGPVSHMFIDSLEVNTEQDDSLTYEGWEKMKNIKSNI